ncbi:MAG: exodeoxyribonuclease III [Candidatus Coatesbacteria bacterium]|nr:MAG: exodeoxyribonuclease III [Candidatus Coatesbacteria bacterium]
MKNLRILSWNVNGLRAVYKKGFLDWFRSEGPDVLCLQETKAAEDRVPPELKDVEGYRPYFASAERKGYSGVATYSKVEPETVGIGFGVKEFDSEGRTLVADFGGFVLFNVYFPNGKASAERLEYKMAFYDAFLKHVNGLRKAGRNVVFCGDVNTAHKEIDLARPKENQHVSGFLPEERAWIDRLLASGFVDTFRMFDGEPERYTWWDYKTRARGRNVGWRLDYFFVSESLRDRVKDAFILSDVMGSDHCPVGIELAI